MKCSKCGSDVDEGQKFCSQCGNPLTVRSEIISEQSVVNERNDQIVIQELISRVSKLEQRLPDSDILSNKFWRRALAVFGHWFSVWVTLYGVLILVIGILLAIVFLVARFRGH